MGAWGSLKEKGSSQGDTESEVGGQCLPCCAGKSDKKVIVNNSLSSGCYVVKSLQSRPTLLNSVDCSLPGFSVYRNLQARILVASPGDLPRPGIKPMSPALASGFFTTEPPARPYSCKLKIRGK